MNWLKKIMTGRYGSDQLSMTLLILSLLITMTARLMSLPLLIFLSYVPLWICIFRMLSKNIPARRMENQKFLVFLTPISSLFKKKGDSPKESTTCKCFICPNCKTELWIPKGKGRTTITCHKCKTEFKKRT